MVQGAFFICVGFLLGSVLFSYHLPLWLKRVNIVELSPDHNPGTVNAIKLAGKPIGLTCLALDMLKGFAPVIVARLVMGAQNPFFPFVMLAPVLGHALAPWYGFPGGKAIATAFGVLAGLLPYSFIGFVLVFWYVFFSLIVVIRPHERRTVVAFLFFIASCGICVYWTHRFNIALGCLLIALVPIYKNYVDLRHANAAPEQARGLAPCIPEQARGFTPCIPEQARGFTPCIPEQGQCPCTPVREQGECNGEQLPRV